MSENHTNALRSIATEIVIVVVGILIAFALNAWWEGRRNVEKETAYLAQLRTDFQANVKALQAQVEREIRIKDASLEILRLIRRTGRPDPDVVRAHLGRVFSSTRPRIALGAYQSLISTGDLSLLRDIELRQELSAFAALVNTDYQERFEDEAYFNLIRDSAGRLQNLRQFSAAQLTELGIEPARDNWDPASLLNDPRFADQIVTRYSVAREMEPYYQTRTQRAEAILRRLGGAVSLPE